MELQVLPHRRRTIFPMSVYINEHRYTEFSSYTLLDLIPLANYVALREWKSIKDRSKAFAAVQECYRKDAGSSEEEFQKCLFHDGIKYIRCLKKAGTAFFELAKYIASTEIDNAHYQASWLQSVDVCLAELRKLAQHEPSAEHREHVVGSHGGLVAIECKYEALLDWLSGFLAAGVQATGMRRREEIARRLGTTRTTKLLLPPLQPSLQLGDFVLEIAIHCRMCEQLRHVQKNSPVTLRAIVGEHVWVGMANSIKAQSSTTESCIDAQLDGNQDCVVRITIGRDVGMFLMEKVYSGF